MFENFLKEYEKIKIETGIYIMLYFLTATFYPLFQIGRVEVVLNKVFKKEIININIIYVCLVIFGILSYLLIGGEERPITIDIIYCLLWIVYFIFSVVVSFNISKEFEFLFIREKIKLPESLKFNFLLLILLNFIYINYKFNQFLDLELKK